MRLSITLTLTKGEYQMYHLRAKGSHYEIGHKWGSTLVKYNKSILNGVPFEITKEHYLFSKECLPYYEQFFPEIIEEIKGIADGQKCNFMDLIAVLFSMYCLVPSTHCSCLAIKTATTTIFGRNSDFLTAIEKLYMNAIYQFTNSSYAFNANTTAFVEMEDGVNAYGLAIGLTSVYPTVVQPGLNAGMLLRLFLEKCKNVPEVIALIKKVKIASSQTFTLCDAMGNIALIECNAKEIAVIQLDEKNSFVCATNAFHTEKMRKYNDENHDNWQAEERYQTMKKALEKNQGTWNLEFVKKVLCGKYGFLCQYDRKSGKDSVWSIVYESDKKSFVSN